MTVDRPPCSEIYSAVSNIRATALLPIVALPSFLAPQRAHTNSSSAPMSQKRNPRQQSLSLSLHIDATIAAHVFSKTVVTTDP